MVEVELSIFFLKINLKLSDLKRKNYISRYNIFMFVWLASYPKSGNTLVRSMLSAYFFSKDGVSNFDLIKNIKQFPNADLFQALGLDLGNDNELIKNYIKAQEFINKKNEVQFFKTHSHLFNIEDNNFTDLNNSLGAIYIIRDPRNVVTSLTNFLDISITKATDHLIHSTHIGGISNSNKREDIMKTYTGTWSDNFNSWKSFKSNRKYLLIKYEDLISNKEENLKKILKFIYKLKNINFEIDETKIKNVIQSTSFENMKNLEKEKGFEEARISTETKEKIPFFNLGPKNEWKKLLDLGFSDFKILFVGGGLFVNGKEDLTYINEFKEKALSLGLSKNIIFSGWIDPNLIVNYLNIMDVVPMLEMDPSGGSILREAMACGRVALSVDGPSKTQRNFMKSNNSILVPHDNYIHEAAKEIIKLRENSKRIKDIGENARIFSIKNLSFETQAKDILSYYI